MVRIIGDVHGMLDKYKKIAQGAEYSIQIGDMGFDYTSLSSLSHNHRWFGGNHDNYDKYYDEPHALGDYGHATLGDLSFFFIRGAFSIDHMYRNQGIDFWDKEQLSVAQMNDCQKLWNEIQPDLVITHTCPQFIADRIGNDNFLRNFGYEIPFRADKTALFFNELFESHHPKMWVFGHFHQNRNIQVVDTEFICIGELCYIDLQNF